MSEKIIVSVIIPTFNALKKLINALQSIEKIEFSFKYYEVIVVDDGSNDGTGRFIYELRTQTKLKLHYIYQENRGPAAARNTGIAQAKGRYILIIDSDCIVEENILNNFLKHFPDDKLGGVGGDVIPDSTNAIAQFLDYIGVWRPSRNNNGIAYLVTANAFFLKEAIIKAGNFDEAFHVPGGEEPDLCLRLIKQGYYFKYDKKAVVFHSHRTTLSGMSKMFINHGRGRGLLARKWPDEYGYEPSFIGIILGKNTFVHFIGDYLKNLDMGTAFIFGLLDYLRAIMFYYGYRTYLRNR